MFRNIVLPDYEKANALEDSSARQVADAGYFKNIEVGAGAKTFKMDERGIWMGSSDFDDAPFKVDMEGNIDIRATTLTEDVAFRFYDSDGNLSIFIGFEE